MTKPDRRIARTRRQFSEALLELLKEKGSDKISIQEIADRADLSRATFYLHYKTKDELLIETLERLFEPITRISPLSRDSMLQDGEIPALIVFRHVEEHRELYKVMLNAGSAWRIAQTIRKYSAKAIRGMLDATLEGQEPPFPVEVLAQHMAASLHWLTVWWLENETPYTADEMAAMYHTMNAAAMIAALSTEQS